MSRPPRVGLGRADPDVGRRFWLCPTEEAHGVQHPCFRGTTGALGQSSSGCCPYGAPIYGAAGHCRTSRGGGHSPARSSPPSGPHIRPLPEWRLDPPASRPALWGKAGPGPVLCCAARAVPCRAVLCCALLCCAVLCCGVLCCAVLCCTVLCCAALCCALLCYAVLCCAVPCRAVPCYAARCCAVLFCATLCCAVLYSAVLCCAVLCCAMLCCAVRAVLCCALLCCVVLCCAVLCSQEVRQ